MSRKKITLKLLKETLDHNRSSQKGPYLIKYIANFVDQKEIGPKLIQNTVESLGRAKKKGAEITEPLIVQAFKRELDELVGETNYWKSTSPTQQYILTQQILALARLNKLLHGTLTGQVDIRKLVDEDGFKKLTVELTPGQIWNLEMKKARERKAKERAAKAAKEKAAKEAEKEKVENITEDLSEPVSAWAELEEHLTPEEIEELKELNKLTF